MKRVTVAACAAVLAAACSGHGATDPLSLTAKHLGDVRSATMSFALTFRSGGTKGPVGFRVDGPFSIPRDGTPTYSLRYTALGSTRAPITIVRSGATSYIEAGGRRTPLPVNAAPTGGSGGSPLGSVAIGRWFTAARTTDGGLVDGTDTDHVSSPLDTKTALVDLGRLAAAYGATSSPLGALDDQGSEQIARTVRASSVDLWSGHRDHLLRRLRIHLELGAGAEQLPQRLRSLLPVVVELTLDLSGVNGEVSVSAPPSG